MAVAGVFVVVVCPKITTNKLAVVAPKGRSYRKFFENTFFGFAPKRAEPSPIFKISFRKFGSSAVTQSKPKSSKNDFLIRPSLQLVNTPQTAHWAVGGSPAATCPRPAPRSSGHTGRSRHTLARGLNETDLAQVLSSAILSQKRIAPTKHRNPFWLKV